MNQRVRKHTNSGFFRFSLFYGLVTLMDRSICTQKEISKLQSEILETATGKGKNRSISLEIPIFGHFKGNGWPSDFAVFFFRFSIPCTNKLYKYSSVIQVEKYKFFRADYEKSVSESRWERKHTNSEIFKRLILCHQTWCIDFNLVLYKVSKYLSFGTKKVFLKLTSSPAAQF